MSQTIVKNGTDFPIKVHVKKEDQLSDQILYPKNRVTLDDLKGSTISFDEKVTVTTRRKVGSCFPRTVKKTLKNIDSVDIITHVHKITISK